MGKKLSCHAVIKQFCVLLFVLLVTTKSNAMLDDNTLIKYQGKLNSQIIEATFGSYGVEVISQNSKRRLSNLYSGNKIMRTCAVVDYSVPIHESLIEAHREIVAGGSIGATLTKHGLHVLKKSVYFGQIKLTNSLKNAMQVDSTVGAIHIYKLYAGDIIYCTITEIHSPAYLNIAKLALLYPQEYQHHTSLMPKVKDLVELASNLDISTYKTSDGNSSKNSNLAWMLQHPYLSIAGIGLPIFFIIATYYNKEVFRKNISNAYHLITDQGIFNYKNNSSCIDMPSVTNEIPSVMQNEVYTQCP